MEMIRHSTCRDEPARVIPPYRANVFKQAGLHVRIDSPAMVLRLENNMAMECGERLWHTGSGALLRA